MHSCLENENSPFPINRNDQALTVKPNINEWKNKTDVWKNYCLFHREAAAAAYRNAGLGYTVDTFTKKLKKFEHIINKINHNLSKI